MCIVHSTGFQFGPKVLMLTSKALNGLGSPQPTRKLHSTGTLQLERPRFRLYGAGSRAGSGSQTQWNPSYGTPFFLGSFLSLTDLIKKDPYSANTIPRNSRSSLQWLTKGLSPLPFGRPGEIVTLTFFSVKWIQCRWKTLNWQPWKSTFLFRFCRCSLGSNSTSTLPSRYSLSLAMEWLPGAKKLLKSQLLIHFLASLLRLPTRETTVPKVVVVLEEFFENLPETQKKKKKPIFSVMSCHFQVMLQLRCVV